MARSLSGVRSVLVTGASGFVGRHLVARLVGSGVTVFALAREKALNLGVEVEPLDLTEGPRLLEWTHAHPPQAIVHLASVIPDIANPGADAESLRQNTATMLNVLAAARHHGSALVYASSSAIYGSLTAGEVAAEESRPRPESLYALSKHFGELLVEHFQRVNPDVPACSLRISAPYGPGNRRMTVVERFVRRALEGQDLVLFGTGERTQTFTHVADVVSAICAALEARASGLYNVAGPEAVSMRELAATAIAAVPGSRSSITFAGEPDPQEHYRARLPIERAAQALGWRPAHDLRSGLSDLASHWGTP